MFSWFKRLFSRQARPSTTVLIKSVAKNHTFLDNLQLVDDDTVAFGPQLDFDMNEVEDLAVIALNVAAQITLNDSVPVNDLSVAESGDLVMESNDPAPVEVEAYDPPADSSSFDNSSFDSSSGSDF